MNEKILNRCCFTGHRPEKLILNETNLVIVETKVKDWLRPVIKSMVNSGKKTFITGMARGFDLWAADIVLKEKKSDAQIKLISVIPFPGVEARWHEKEQWHFKEVLNNADFVKVIAPEFNIGCFQQRNRFMVDHASTVITAFNGASGGTKNTLFYAKKQGVEIINIL